MTIQLHLVSIFFNIIHPPNHADMYWIVSATGRSGPVQVYCDMDGSNCDSHGGWMRVVKVDLNVSDNCMANTFEVFNANGRKVCR